MSSLLTRLQNLEAIQSPISYQPVESEEEFAQLLAWEELQGIRPPPGRIVLVTGVPSPEPQPWSRQ